MNDDTITQLTISAQSPPYEPTTKVNTETTNILVQDK